MSAAETWARFERESEACSSRLNSKLRDSLQSIQDLLRCQVDALDNALKTNSDAVNLDRLDNIFNTTAQSLLVEPVEKYRRNKPQQRVTEALHDWDTAIEGVIGAMPEFLTMRASEWIALMGTKDMNLAARLRLGWNRTSIRVSFRQNLLYGFHLHRAKRLRLEGRLMCVIAESSLELIGPWESVIQAWLPLVLSNNSDSGSIVTDLGELRRRIGVLETQMASILNDVSTWSLNASSRMANAAPFRRDVSFGKDELDHLNRKYFRHRNFWVRQARAVESDIDLEYKLRIAEHEATRTAREVLTGIEKEHRELLSELETVVTWLGSWKRSEHSTFPPATANIASAVNRLDRWTNAINAILDYLPETVEVPARIRARPPRRRTFRTQAPRAVCRESFKRQGEAVIRDGLDYLERQHRSIVREIERAREVVAFASEMAQVGKAEDLQVEREGIENARSLLEFHRTQTQDVPPEVERSLVSAVAAGFLRTHTMLEAGQFGVARQAARHGLPVAGRKLAMQAADKLRKGATTVGRSGAESYRELLIRIGWIPAPTARMPHVITRGYLSRTLGVESRLDQMPMIYQRLFRLTPVEDPRFLVGRHDEMNALAEARRLWEADHEAAVIIVGERGSGKTSLLNCAVQGPLSGLEIIRADFSERLTRRDDMYKFLGDLLKTEPAPSRPLPVFEFDPCSHLVPGAEQIGASGRTNYAVTERPHGDGFDRPTSR